MQSTALNNVFTQKVLTALVEEGSHPTLDYAIDAFVTYSGSITYLEAIQRLYSFMFKNHRNEYVYKNSLLNKILLGRHSLQTSTALTEIPIGKAVADFVIINGKAIVYEIKTDLDNFKRLEDQIENYYQVFDNVCVVCSENNFNTLEKELRGSSVGICVLTNRGSISERKESLSFKGSLSHEAIFKVLRKAEFEAVINAEFGYLPDVPSVFYYKTCYQLFSEIPIEKLQLDCIKVLKSRKNGLNKKAVESAPKELKMLTYFSKLSNNKLNDLSTCLLRPYGG